MKINYKYFFSSRFKIQRPEYYLVRSQNSYSKQYGKVQGKTII